MAKYQSMLVVIDPNQDDQPALRRAVYLHQRIGGRLDPRAGEILPGIGRAD